MAQLPAGKLCFFVYKPLAILKHYPAASLFLDNGLFAGSYNRFDGF